MDFTSAFGFKAVVNYYDPTFADVNFGVRDHVTWTGTTNMGSYVFQGTDYISLRYSGNNDYPAIDCTFTGAFVLPHYFPTAGYRWVMGVQESNFL